MSPPSQRLSTLLVTLWLLLAMIGLYLGWRLFWFMTDDAYIAFRYASNSISGYGYTWNLPPFRPVEGYTSFLWVLLLEAIWRLAGVEPPDAANVLSLLFALGTLLLSALLLLKMGLRPELDRLRPWLLLLFFLLLLSNRTFLTWASSGLETAMFNFWVLAWVSTALMLPAGAPRWLGALALTAVLAALTRPDGLLLIAASLFLAGLTSWRQWQAGLFRRQMLLWLAPFALTAVHFLWRQNSYGAWLPNTFAAKYVAPWPESGGRYLLSFVMEYALWVWLLLVVGAAVWRGRHFHRPQQWLGTATAPSRLTVVLTVMVTLLAHFAYYTFIIGGDYFEYRVYSHLVPLILLAAIWLLHTVPVRAGTAVAFLTLFWLLSLPLQWVHWLAAGQMPPEAFAEPVPVADRFPSVMRPYVHWYDEVQAWLIQRNVAVRQHQHKLFWQRQEAIYPPRAQGSLLAADAYPVIVLEAVGVAGWALPTTNIIDAHGLNDAIVARNPVPPEQARNMAHDRYLPPGYAECFAPNVRLVTQEKLVIQPRLLTPESIRACETAVWPPGLGDVAEVALLGIDRRRAPLLDRFLWSGHPPEFMVLFYTPAGDTDVNTWLAGFEHYSGLGCLVLPPPDSPPGNDFLFLFLDAENRPAPAAWFPWMPAIAEQGVAYHLGVTAVARPEIQPAPNQAADVSWANQMRLVGYSLGKTRYQPGETINLTLYYQIDGPIDHIFSSYIHLSSSADNPASGGPLWAQQDGNPCRDFYPAENWRSGSTIISKAILPIPTDAPPGVYELNTGFYNWLTGVRVPLADADTEGITVDWIEVTGK